MEKFSEVDISIYLKSFIFSKRRRPAFSSCKNSQKEKQKNLRKKDDKTVSDTPGKEPQLLEHLDSLPPAFTDKEAIKYVNEKAAISSPSKSESKQKQDLSLSKAETLTNSTRQILYSLMLDRGKTSNASEACSAIGEASARTSLISTTNATEMKYALPVDLVEEMLNSLSLGAGYDAAELSKAWHEEHAKNISKEMGQSNSTNTRTGNDSDSSDDDLSDADTDQEFDELSHCIVQKKNSNKDSKNNDESANATAKGRLLRSSPGTRLQLEFFLHQSYSYFDSREYSNVWRPKYFSQIENICKSVVKVGICMVFGTITRTMQTEKLDNLMSCAVHSLRYLTGLLDQSRKLANEDGKRNLLMELLQNTREPQSFTCCVERLLSLAVASFRLHDTATTVNLIQISSLYQAQQAFLDFIKILAYSILDECLLFKSKHHDRKIASDAKALKSCLQCPPLSSQLAKSFDINLSEEEAQAEKCYEEIEVLASQVRKCILSETDDNLPLKTRRSSRRLSQSVTKPANKRKPLYWSQSIMERPFPRQLDCNNMLSAAKSCITLQYAVSGVSLKVNTAQLKSIRKAVEKVVDVTDIEQEASSQNNTQELIDEISGLSTPKKSPTQRVDKLVQIVNSPVIKLATTQITDSPFAKRIKNTDTKLSKYILKRYTSMATSRKTPATIAIPLGKEIMLGRSSVSDVRLISKDKVFTQAVSRRHAKLSFDDGGDKCFIIDNKSANGVFVNCIRIEPNKRVYLKEGDIVIFGGGGKTPIGGFKRFKSEFRFIVETFKSNVITI